MNWTWLAILAVALIVILKVVSRGKDRSSRQTLFMKRDVLFTAAERSFLGVLDQASSGRYRIFGKVRIADVLAPARGLDKSARATALNRISAKHFDFVLCDPNTLQVQAVIELNDKSHSTTRRIERDELVARACAEAGLALRMVKAQSSYSIEAVKQILDEVNIAIRAEPS
jgi:hypothetical protein